VTSSSSSVSAAVQGARINGAAWIIAIDPVEFKQKSARQFGATHAIGSVEEAIDLTRDLTHGVMADSVVLSPSLIGKTDIADALKLTRKGAPAPSPAWPHSSHSRSE
jgi:Zn-dependent alcohol dehydrogenase